MYVSHMAFWSWFGSSQTIIYIEICTTDITELTSPALPSFSSPSLCFSGSTAIFFNSIKNELSFCCPFIMKQNQKSNKSANEAWIDQQSHVCRKSKCTLQSLLELRGTPNLKTTHTHKVWNDSHFRLISSPIFQSLLLLLPFIRKYLHMK